MPRPYSLETYSQVMDLDGFPHQTTPRIGLIVSLTLVQDKADEIREVNGRAVLEPSSIRVHHREEVFFRIVQLLGDNHFQVELYDFFRRWQGSPCATAPRRHYHHPHHAR
jgi:hypothetical protein